MKITASKLFDTDLVVKALEAAKVTGLQDFISNLSEISDQVIRALKNKISLQDNIDCSEKEIALFGDIPLNIANPIDGRRVRHILVSRTRDVANPVTTFAWQYTAKGEIELNVAFKTFKSKNTVTLLMFY